MDAIENRVLQVTDKNFAATVETGVVLLDFWAAWCGPCRMFAPVFEAAARRHPGVTFGKVDTDAQPALAAAFEVRAIPTLVVLRDGVLLAAEPGMVSGVVLDQIIEEAHKLDMDEVRRQLHQVQEAAR